MESKRLPGPEHLSRKLLRLLLSEEYQVVKRSRIGGTRRVWGLHDDVDKRLFVRRGLHPDEQRRTLIHEGLHALYPPEEHPHATEEAIEERTLRVDRHLGLRRRKKIEYFLPPD